MHSFNNIKINEKYDQSNINYQYALYLSPFYLDDLEQVFPFHNFEVQHLVSFEGDQTRYIHNEIYSPVFKKLLEKTRLRHIIEVLKKNKLRASEYTLTTDGLSIGTISAGASDVLIQFSTKLLLELYLPILIKNWAIADRYDFTSLDMLSPGVLYNIFDGELEPACDPKTLKQLLTFLGDEEMFEVGLTSTKDRIYYTNESSN